MACPEQPISLTPPTYSDYQPFSDHVMPKAAHNDDALTGDTGDEEGQPLVVDNMDKAILHKAKDYVYQQTLKDIFPPQMCSNMNIYLV
jgi:hypothetical protein